MVTYHWMRGIYSNVTLPYLTIECSMTSKPLHYTGSLLARVLLGLSFSSSLVEGFHDKKHIKIVFSYSWCFLFALLQNKPSLPLYTFSYQTSVSSGSCFFWLTRCGFRLLPSFRWGIYSNVTLPFMTISGFRSLVAWGAKLTTSVVFYLHGSARIKTAILILAFQHIPANVAAREDNNAARSNHRHCKA